MSKKAPQRAKRPCLVSSCKEYASNQGYCEDHQDKIRTKDRQRGTAHQRGYDARWDKARLEHLDEYPLCIDHKKRGYIEVATVVDHIIPHKGDQKLFWDRDNWQSLCKPCHDRKTQLEDRGSWSPVAPKNSKANMQSINPFFVDDIALVITGHVLESLQCKMTDQFIVTAVESNSIVVDDKDGFAHRLHHSHFKKLI